MHREDEYLAEGYEYIAVRPVKDFVFVDTWDYETLAGAGKF
jgi:hypothetical protein